VRWIGRGTCRCDHVEQALVATGNLRPRLPSAHAVKTGIHYNTVQPCRYRRFAAEARCSPEGGDHGVLQRIRGVFGVGECPYRHRPEPVPMANEQLAERIAIAIDVQAQQLAVGELATVSRGQAWVSNARLLTAARVDRDCRLAKRCVARIRLTLRGQPPPAFSAARA
jgi:hypothetical protein